ncbi:MBL fold metallo-hydrolase [Mucilaginibacter ginsenosidivorans]|uniref:MBL fold metallo-hydrolase n=1 Tax=Mucilaginibacter ginsenosidivorans TaxID=398053 RepID=A0A5B8UWF7_9SPHI|nr:MBL fold metallo-hydrolase [Mucilaginibacter ginsenosidivorans]QEC63252.1 MBL fold metallo-hydrolase [Mucilaginibacter ginsenosidivorans]
MKRRNFIFNTALAAGAFSIFGKSSFASVLADQSYQFKPLRRNVGMFAEQGGTIAWLVNKEGIVVVDAEFPDPAKHLIAELQKQSDKPFQWLINTHHHGDHTSGNISFKGIVKNVAAHANSLTNQKNSAIAQKKEDQQLYPDTTFTDTWKIRVGDESIKAYYFGPGHTNGDSMIHFEHANVVHMGDLIFNRRYPFIDKSAGASVKNWPVTLEMAQKKFDKDTLFVFGHAFDPLKVTGDMEDIKAMQNYMEKLADFVQGSIKDGKSKDEILQAKSIPGVTDWQGDGINRSLEAAYQEFTS